VLLNDDHYDATGEVEAEIIGDVVDFLHNHHDDRPLLDRCPGRRCSGERRWLGRRGCRQRVDAHGDGRFGWCGRWWW
jgi:hypothetical protein